jgi:hypothetical protein
VNILSKSGTVLARRKKYAYAVGNSNTIDNYPGDGYFYGDSAQVLPMSPAPLPFLNVNIPDEINIQAFEYNEYANSEDQPIWDKSTGEMLRDPVTGIEV